MALSADTPSKAVPLRSGCHGQSAEGKGGTSTKGGQLGQQLPWTLRGLRETKGDRLKQRARENGPSNDHRKNSGKASSNQGAKPKNKILEHSKTFGTFGSRMCLGSHTPSLHHSTATMLRMCRTAALGARAVRQRRPISRAVCTWRVQPCAEKPAAPPGGATQEPPAHRGDAFEAPKAEPSDEPMSFIDKAATMGANVLLGAFTHVGHRFDRVLKDMRVDKIDTKAGRVVCTLPVTPGVQNAYGTLHGGCVATLVDVVGTMALLAANPKRPGVSVDMSVSFVAAAKAGSEVVVEGRYVQANVCFYAPPPCFTLTRATNGQQGAQDWQAPRLLAS